MDDLPSHAGSYNNIVALISVHRTFCGFTCVCIVETFQLLHQGCITGGKTLYGHVLVTPNV